MRTMIGRSPSSVLFRVIIIFFVVLIIHFCFLPLTRVWPLRHAGEVKNHYVELVVASVTNDNTSWVHEYFPQYPANIYVMDDPYATLTVAKNKGRESAAYLTWVTYWTLCFLEGSADWLSGTLLTTTIICLNTLSFSMGVAISGIMRIQSTVRLFDASWKGSEQPTSPANSSPDGVPVLQNFKISYVTRKGFAVSRPSPTLFAT